MLLIIEGMDRCGKSTLINNLRRTVLTSPRTIVHHSSSPPKTAVDPSQWEIEHYSALFDEFTDISNKMNFDIICDRLHLGAIVYGKMFRNADPEDIYEIEYEFLEDRDDVCLVLLTDNGEAIMSRDDGESLEKSVDGFNETSVRFQNAFNDSCIRNKLHINISDNGGFENTLPTVKKFLETIES